ncbi:MAG: acyltransferase [Ignavibacteriae bacterium]|nr:acyltransferase [Ignavibacteriota bacterium]
MRLTDNKKGIGSNIKDSFNTPWKVYHLVLSILLTPFYRLYFILKGVKWKRGWRLFGMPIIHKYRCSTIEIGSNFSSRNWFSSNPIGINNRTLFTTWNKDAKIIIGDNVGISGVTICSFKEVVIKDNVLIGANTKIFDTDFHPLSPFDREKGIENVKTASVLIEKNVFIGTNVMILKGVTVGENSIIGAGSIVSSNISPNSIAIGNPAKVIKTYS